MNSNRLFQRVLIANRGEIACRIIRTLQRLNIETVAVYSSVDRRARHVAMADYACCLGGASAADSYLNMSALIDVAQQLEVDAIHPGYGFLSENADFARQCEAQGITLIGPPAAAMMAMGSKASAKELMAAAGVPLVPGYHGEQQETDFLRQQARTIGFPVLLKASLGGGGKGMRLVHSDNEFADSLAACRREAQAAFGDDHILLEKYIQQPRHVEIQIFADQHGQCVYLFERDCSIQRRHQKVLEEAPAPGLDSTLRDAMGQAAVRAARAIGYVGAGTVEFLLAADGEFYFMEMNTRLQVEHPVTEMITGQDLVEWQVRVAEGAQLPKTQPQLAINGHAIEVRIYAEDPAHDFLPATGTIRYLQLPAQSTHVRVDSGVEQGDEVSVYYDPMLAKLIVWDINREQAIHRLRNALQYFHLVGVKTNVGFLASIIEQHAFQSADLSTHFIEDHSQQLLLQPMLVTQQDYILAAVWQYCFRSSSLASDPWQQLAGWQLNAGREQTFVFASDGSPVMVQVAAIENKTATIRVDIQAQSFSLRAVTNGGQLVLSGDINKQLTVVPMDESICLLHSTGPVVIEPYHYRKPLQQEHAEQHLRAPMNGRVVATAVTAGQTVAPGDPLITVEAMKMEHCIRAVRDGRVKEVFFAVGDLVKEGDELIAMERDLETATEAGD